MGGENLRKFLDTEIIKKNNTISTFLWSKSPYSFRMQENTD